MLNLENFQNYLYATIRSTNYGATAFYLLWIIIGKYVFLTLFLAVVLEVRQWVAKPKKLGPARLQP